MFNVIWSEALSQQDRWLFFGILLDLFEDPKLVSCAELGRLLVRFHFGFAF
jgi:hypothetical protein